MKKLDTKGGSRGGGGYLEGSGTGTGTEPVPSEPAATVTVSDAVPLRAGQTNPIKARNRSPSTSPVPDAVGRKLLFGPMAENDLVGAGRGRQRADRTGPDRKYAS